MFANRTLLITGGTGSFGNAVIERFIETDIDFGEIRIFSRDEKKQDDLRKKLDNPKFKFFIGDVRDYRSVSGAVKGVDYIFHAAALKQVPTCEFFPIEAIKTNVLGAENVIEAAITHGVKKVVVLSTDKAVYPINAMGMSKALMEKVMIAKSREANCNPLLCATRYGNVMGSRGSVIPLFVQQIKECKPLTMTNPDMSRFMMTLDEAVDLVLYAFENAEPGDIFVSKAPASTVGDIAKALLELYNATSEIMYIGIRHGEKVFETLVNREEMVKVEEAETHFRIPADTRGLNYDIFFSKGESSIFKAQEYTSHNTRRLNLDETKEMLLKLDAIRKDIERSQR